MFCRVQLCVLFVLLALLAGACGSSGTSSGLPDDAAAMVGDIKIPKDRLDLLMKQAKIAYAKSRRPFPTPGTRQYRTLRARAAAYLVVGAIYEGHAKEDGIEPTDAEIAAQVELAKRQQYGPTKAQQEKAMKAQAMTDGELAAQAALKVVQNRVQEMVFKDIKVTDADVKAFYEKNKDRFTIPETREIRQILVSSKKLAEELRDRARSGSDFATLARKYSTDRPSARHGGKAAITKGQTVKAFDEVAFSIPTGKISDVIVTQYGWQILQAISPVQPAQTTPLSDVSASIRRQLLQDRRERALGRWQLAAKHQFCDGDKITYAPGYKPLPEDNPCAPSGRQPA